MVMVSAPLLKEHSQAVLLTSYLPTVQAKRLHKGPVDFYKKLLCMRSQTVSLLTGA